MSKNKLIIIGGIGGLIVLGLLIFVLLGSVGGIGGEGEEATLEFWGVFDEPTLYSDVIRGFQRENPGVKINYRLFSYNEYEKRLLDGFASGTGPDIWLMHNTWLPQHGDKIAPLPQNIENQEKPLLTVTDFKRQFVDVTLADLVYNDQIYAMPIYVDTLALYYNKDVFNTAGIATPPATWNEFNKVVEKITQLDDRGGITRAGAALGTARNINRSTDILSLLLLQSGVKMTNGENTNATFADSIDKQDVADTALQFYTDFANSDSPVYTWNNIQHYSVDAFTENNAAVMFNYSHQIANLRDKAARLNFGIANMPQFNPSDNAVNYANYWAPTVSKQSKFPITAWKFLIYLSSEEGATTYLNASGRPAARRDLITVQQNEADLGIFAEQALSARSWYQADNVAIENILADMIDEVNFGRATIHEALVAAENKVSVLMRR